jgi:hypothetical protein
VKQAKFEGKFEELKGHIHDCADLRQSDIYTRTTREVGEYVERNYKYSSDVKMFIKKLLEETIPKLNDLLTNAMITQNQIWEKEVDEYVKQKCQLEENLIKLYFII